ncbi:MAG TPA: PfkB family carbohydrate kinase [Beutenbergiaceae bacterium]|nr:PfkB family carbohydrate kinase [Beutenbergiaceae bacterium]
MTRVIDTGQALVDLVIEVPDLPVRGGNVMAQTETRYAGGSVNILLAAARAGVRGVLAGAHGTGPNGDLIRSALSAEDVAISPEPVAGVDTGLCVVLVEPGGERTFITTLGAERQISIESLQTSDPQAGDLITVTGYSLLEPTAGPLLRWLAQIADVGAQVIFDPGAVFADLPQRVRNQMLASTAVWTSNAEEAAGATGLADPGAAAEKLRDMLPAGGVAIVRDGERGCYLNTGAGTERIAGFPQRAVDTNGAGDAHTGALAAELALGADWHTAAHRANVAGAIKVTRKGPATAPTRAEVDDFLAGAAAN